MHSRTENSGDTTEQCTGNTALRSDVLSDDLLILQCYILYQLCHTEIPISYSHYNDPRPENTYPAIGTIRISITFPTAIQTNHYQIPSLFYFLFCRTTCLLKLCNSLRKKMLQFQYNHATDEGDSCRYELFTPFNSTSLFNTTSIFQSLFYLNVFKQRFFFWQKEIKTSIAQAIPYIKSLRGHKDGTSDSLAITMMIL